VFIYRGEGNIERVKSSSGLKSAMNWWSRRRKAQEQIVTSANFLIDSEAQLQAQRRVIPPPPGAGQAASMNAPAQQQASVALTTIPTSAQGSNIVRVKLTAKMGNRSREQT